MLKRLIILFLVIVITQSCGFDDPTEITDGFDRSKMLVNWADNIIIPAYRDYNSKLSTLQGHIADFNGATTEENLQMVRTSWLSAYKAWQHVSIFEIGMAESLSLRNYTNIYPADASQIEKNIASGTYNLELPSKNDEQGFSALDYLINGLGVDNANIISKYNDQTTGSKYKTYLTDVIDRLADLTRQVVTDWNGDYRDTFVQDVGSSATSTTNKLINDYIYYYEKYLRAGKVGIPAGVFSGSPISTSVEAFYYGKASKILFNEALQATQDFFNGKHFNSDTNGESLKSYLDYLNTIKEGSDLSSMINNRFDSSKSAATQLDDNFSDQVNNNNSLMLHTYDELQENVVLMKVDMLQALNVKVDYVDADGD